MYYDIRLENADYKSLNNHQYKLHKSEDFERTKELKRALSPFLGRIGGFHIAIICRTIQPGCIVLEEANNLFSDDYKEITNEMNWKKGYYKHCEERDNIFELLESVFEKINCLGITLQTKEIDSAKQNEKTRTEHNLSFKDVWTEIRAIQLSDDLKPREENNDNCADVKIIIIVPEDLFEVFSDPECYFPSFIEFVLRYRSEEELLDDYNKLEKEFGVMRKEQEKAQKVESELRQTISDKNQLVKESQQTISDQNQLIKESQQTISDQNQLIKELRDKLSDAERKNEEYEKKNNEYYELNTKKIKTY